MNAKPSFTFANRVRSKCASISTASSPSAPSSGAPNNSDYEVEFDYSLVDCNLTDNQGATDGGGGGTFKIKVLGPNYEGGSVFGLTLSPRGHSDFQEATLEVTIDPGDFS